MSGSLIGAALGAVRGAVGGALGGGMDNAMGDALSTTNAVFQKQMEFQTKLTAIQQSGQAAVDAAKAQPR
jgi:hypothetical protein